ncbi:AAA family ATPase [Bradyrhizobium sp. 35]|uniref:AAA family ATPase n=1 Tax=Bradyrhizobium sp. 35 TaxID=2782670 RepID=UPI001FF73594|nr:AAA family ATPase [Bradyrhizobium sp. 35]MCK1452965.1 AAA family ATPase [Bradyrhizobium sp. 35]
MYLRSLAIDGVRSIESLRMDFEPGQEPGWHVIVGPNGSGKSSIVKAFALSMLDEADVKQLPREIPSSFLRHGRKSGKIEVVAVSAAASVPKSSKWEWQFKATGRASNASLKLSAATKKLPWHDRPVFTAAFGASRRLTGDPSLASLAASSRRLGAHLSALSEAASLSAGQEWLYELYSEEQRLERGARTALKQFLSSAAVTSILDKMIRNFAKRDASGKPKTDPQPHLNKLSDAFRKCLDEVVEAYQMRHGSIVLKAIGIDVGKKVEETEFDFELDSLSRRIIRFLNQSQFIFDSVKITEPTRDRLLVRDFTNAPLALEDLSDGYRTLITLVLEILRQMLQTAGPRAFMDGLESDPSAIDLPGVVAIDEIEAHLHPTWQALIGQWLQKCFPRVQFIITTHSPIVCRAMAVQGELRGSLWKLPERNSSQSFGRITGHELDRVLYGDLVEALGTNIFGTHVEQSRDSTRMLDSLAALNVKALRSSLSQEEMRAQEALRKKFPARPTILK